MKRFIIFCFPVIIFASCIKDRTPPAAPVVVVSTSDTLMYYWSFNGQDSSAGGRIPDYSVNSGATFSYSASYIDFTTGSDLNLWGGADTSTGSALRARNPSQYLIFYMPTTGFDSVVLTYAEEASGSGSSINSVTYTTDGVTFDSAALVVNGASNSYNVGLTFALTKFDFSADPLTNNNPKFAVKITFDNNNTGTSGNDRFDNVSLQGVRK